MVSVLGPLNIKIPFKVKFYFIKKIQKFERNQDSETI